MINLLRRKLFLNERLSSQKGVTAVEMALVAPVFIMIFMGIMEISLMMLTQHMMENATFNASRLGKTGYAVEGKTQEETVVDALTTELSSLTPLVDMDKFTFTYTSYGSLSDIGKEETGTAGLGEAQEVVVYTVSYPWKFFTPLIGDLMGNENRIVTLTSRLVVRNEPY